MIFCIRYLFTCLFFVSCANCFGYELSVCAIFQDEAPYLKEWIEFHKIQGAEHFYLYNNNSTDDFRDVLDPYIHNHEVTLIEWPKTYSDGDRNAWDQIQRGAYMDCMQRFGEDNRWIAVIDIDEFLFCPKGEKLTHFLEEYRSFAGVGVNWRMFGTSHIEELPSGAVLIEQLTQCNKRYHWENWFYKSIVQPKYVIGCACAHSFEFKEGMFTVDYRKKKITDAYRALGIFLKRIRINHYCTRTEKYLREKKIPSRLKRRPNQTTFVEMITLYSEAYNKRNDTDILQFVSELRDKIKY